MPKRSTADADDPIHESTPRDDVRRIPLPGFAIALVGIDHTGVPRKTVILEERDVTPEEIRSIQRWVRKNYPAPGTLHSV